MINKGYVMKLQDIVRWVLHFPIGGVIAWFILTRDLRFMVLGFVIALFFLAYEVMEDWRVRDRSFIDIFGSLLAMIAGGMLYKLWLM